MKAKKILIIILALVLVFSFTACKSGGAGDQGGSVPYEKHVMDYPGSIDPFEDGASSYDGIGDHFDSPYFKILDVYNMEPTETLHIIPNFETYQQSTEYSCGAVSSLLVLNYYGVNDYDELTICQMGDVSDETGVGVTGVLKFFDSIGWNTESNRDGNIDFDPYLPYDDPNSFPGWVMAHLDEGVPIMVDWLDWAGHWQVIIGYDTMGTDDHFGDDVMIVADPYDTSDHYQDGYFIVPAERFYYMWREGVYTTNQPEFFPWVIATPNS